jgi:hypothetical protein
MESSRLDVRTMEYRITPPEVGYWSLGLGNNNHHYLSTWYKPSKWQRFWMKFLLGFNWKEINNGKL